MGIRGGTPGREKPGQDTPLLLVCRLTLMEYERLKGYRTAEPVSAMPERAAVPTL